MKGTLSDLEQFMKSIVLLFLALLSTVPVYAQEHRGLRWNYSMRISVSYDIVPAQRLSAPTYRTIAPPEYPFEAMRAGLSGVTKVTFVLREDGLVHDAKVSSSSSVDLLDAASLAAVKNWKFYRFNEEVFPGAVANRYSGPITIEAVITYELPDL